MSQVPAGGDAEFKSCCANFYADDVVRKILGDSFHPGGEELTRTILAQVDLGLEDRLLDIAAGQGTSSIIAASEFGCRVTGLDLSEDNLQRATDRAKAAGIAHLFETKVSDAETLPFENDSFDVVLCECAFCIFTDKTTAAGEMARVLRPGGRLALSDMTIQEGARPEGLDSLLLKVACIADAVSPRKMIEYFEKAGFDGLAINDASDGLAQMVKDIKSRLLAAELASKIGKVSLGGVDLDQGRQMIKTALDAIDENIVGYHTLTGNRR